MKLYRLEALRGFAAFYVVLHHTIPENSVKLLGVNLGFLLRFGQEAVILFFILSGFVINYSYTKSKDKSFKTYFTKRILRIYIPLLVVFFISYILASCNAGVFINPEIKTLALNLLMLQDWELVKPNVIAPTYMGNTPLWSLSYEWWFYMLYFPLVNGIRNKQQLHLVVFTMAIISSLIYTFYPYFLPRLFAYLAIWWTGVYLSELHLEGKLSQPHRLILPLAGLIIPSLILTANVLSAHANNAILLLGFHPVLELRHFFFALVAVAGSYIWRRLSWIGFDLALKPFLLLAPISYAIYITHHPLMVTATYLNFIESVYLRWLVYLILVLGISWIIERRIYPLIRNRLYKA